MIGITDTAGFDKITSVSKTYSSDISTYTLRMRTGCDTISRIFQGNDMGRLIDNLSNLSDNMKFISRNVSQNVEFLGIVKRTYERQDEEASRSVSSAI